ncbi:MAG TPA: glycoside hydrolase family 30 protein [Bacteroidales bacterium]|jgi:glucosylceramidase|nr:glycoside hydrolase family 30 protein [Bacteroidales bacterium]
MKKCILITSLIMTVALTASLLTGCNQNTAKQQSGKAGPSLELKTAEMYITAKDSNLRLSAGPQLIFSDLVQPDEHKPTIMLDPNHSFQEIVGIGGAFTDAAAETFYKLPKEKQTEILDAYFTTDKGIGYSLGRTHINSCDFSSESYAYAATEGDKELKSFTIDHDRKFRIPFIKEALAKAGGKITMFASPWSPPAWMKDNNNMLQGGKLKPEFMQSWADYYIRFFEEYKKEGINFWGVSVQNEPMAVQTWESCIYTAEDERDFVKNYMGPALKKSAFADTRLIIWDHNRGLMNQRAKVMYDDPEASKYVWGTGFHWYTGDHFENVKLHAEAFPDKNLIFTEGCAYPFNYDSLNEWHWGETYGTSLINDLNNGACAWTDWNILLDETGGPNHVNNNCFAPVIGNTKTGEVIYMNSFYYLGHFSKFIRPGARRITCASNDDELLATAFLNTDGKIATVVMNKTPKAKDFFVWINNKAVNSSIPAHSIITLIIN